ncbi:hypothetical protein E2493_20780 [Sphingomonas parva]|uniref:DUF3108 domain-containing protein n=1 Tax=Sphingomonas parva TaxID=2555898 RepID=A0A4Y8ZND9_9SPHN|nr:hypothetical protein [Sphingomonas parva]TFI56319.1 hypothetical protein E2493_20780 [Sphingomonas parva]
MRKDVRVLAALALAAAAAGPALCAERMRGFEEIAGAGERVDVTGLSGWHKGRFRIGETGAEGRYRILSSSDHAGGEVAHFGGSRFDLSGPGVAGALSGRCGFDALSRRTRGRIGEVRVTTSTRLVPLAYRCEFARDGEVIGELVLDEVARPGLSVRQERAGHVRIGDARLAFASVHHLDGTMLPTSTPVGYRFEAEGRAVGAVDLNGSRKRLALPDDPALREATLLGSLALALFWDPGDGDD